MLHRGDQICLNVLLFMLHPGLIPQNSVQLFKFDFHPAFGFKSGDELFDDTKEVCCGDDAAACASCSMEYFCHGEEDKMLAKIEASLEKKPSVTQKAFNINEWLKSIH